MTAMTQSQASVGCLVLNVALGKDGKAYQRRLESQLAHNGIEWTCKRAKAIRQVALSIRSGEREKALEVLRDNSIAYHKSTLYPKGIEGVVVRRFVEAQRPAVLKRLSAAMRFYTSLKLSQPSKAQKAKALKAITGTSTCRFSSSWVFSEGSEDWTLSSRRRNYSVKPLRDDPIRSNERHAEHLKSTSRYYSRFKVPPGYGEYPYSSMVMSFMTEPFVPQPLDLVTPCYEMREYIRSDWLKTHPQEFYGRVALLQEQGCKARYVCVPSAWLQLAFRPLHGRISRIAENMFPLESCVNDQTAGANAMLRHMTEGGTVYCTDLSSATDRFPREYTLGVLTAMGYQPYATALREVCAGKFKCDFAPDGQVSYEVGQPMGLYGSFPIFHLSNMLMADHAVRSQRMENPKPFADGSYFKVVGDDIIFSDRGVAQSYCARMSAFGVEISKPKSFSGDVAEFAGFLGLKTNKGVAVFRPYKVPQGETITNPIQFLDAIGASVKNMPRHSRPYWEKQWARYSKTVSSRDLAGEPLLSEGSEPFCSANRGDNRDLVNLAQVLADQSADPIPDLGGNTRINQVPLFRERGPMDYYGFNPESLKRDEELHRSHPMRQVSKRLRQDPLMEEIRRQEQGLNPTFKLVTQPSQAAYPNPVVCDTQELTEEADRPTGAPTGPKGNRHANGRALETVSRALACYDRVAGAPPTLPKDYGLSK